MEAGRGWVAGRRRMVGGRLRGSGTAAFTKPDSRAAADAGCGRLTNAHPQACPELELRNVGTGSARQRGVPELLPNRDGEGARCEDAGAIGTSSRPCNNWRTA